MAAETFREVFCETRTSIAVDRRDCRHRRIPMSGAAAAAIPMASRARASSYAESTTREVPDTARAFRVSASTAAFACKTCEHVGEMPRSRFTDDDRYCGTLQVRIMRRKSFPSRLRESESLTSPRAQPAGTRSICHSARCSYAPSFPGSSCS